MAIMVLPQSFAVAAVKAHSDVERAGYIRYKVVPIKEQLCCSVNNGIVKLQLVLRRDLQLELQNLQLGEGDFSPQEA